MAQPELAVIGAGPKAAALAAGVAATELAGERKPPRLRIFERSYEIGAHWRGGHGYSDGRQRLCTDPERDVAFPGWSDRKVQEIARARYSWRAFLEARGEYHAWSVRDRPRPTHRKYAHYVSWVIDRAGRDCTSISVERGQAVTSLRYVDGRWELSATEGVHDATFDGVVVTGPGRPQQTVDVPADVNDRVFNAKDFWDLDDAQILALRTRAEFTVGIIGGGGAACAVALSLGRVLLREIGADHTITLVSPAASIFTRATTWFDERWFVDLDDAWPALDSDYREEFTKRLVSGVAFEAITSELQSMQQVEHKPDSVVELVVREVGSEVLPALVGSSGTIGTYNLVVDATGFDRWSFLDLLPVGTRRRLKLFEDKLGTIEANVDEALRVPIQDLYNLHVPFLATFARGPGMQSLLSLSRMAEAILRPYLKRRGT